MTQNIINSNEELLCWIVPNQFQGSQPLLMSQYVESLGFNFEGPNLLQLVHVFFGNVLNLPSKWPWCFSEWKKKKLYAIFIAPTILHSTGFSIALNRGSSLIWLLILLCSVQFLEKLFFSSIHSFHHNPLNSKWVRGALGILFFLVVFSSLLSSGILFYYFIVVK